MSSKTYRINVMWTFPDGDVSYDEPWDIECDSVAKATEALVTAATNDEDGALRRSPEGARLEYALSEVIFECDVPVDLEELAYCTTDGQLTYA